MLPPHDWDTAANRTAIHTAFELWSMCWEQGDRRQAARWKRQLKALTDDATVRQGQSPQPSPVPRDACGHQCFTRRTGRGVVV